MRKGGWGNDVGYELSRIHSIFFRGMQIKLGPFIFANNYFWFLDHFLLNELLRPE